MLLASEYVGPVEVQHPRKLIGGRSICEGATWMVVAIKAETPHAKKVARAIDLCLCLRLRRQIACIVSP